MAEVFPRRNLPELAEQWGRRMEDAVTANTTSIDILRQSLQGQNRNTASSLATLAQQIQGLNAVVSALPITRQETNATGSGFSLTGFSSVTPTEILRSSIQVPAGKTLASLQAIATVGAVDLTTGGVTALYADIILNDGAGSLLSTEFAPAKDHGASAVNNVVTGVFGRTATVVPGNTVYASFRLRPLNPAAFGFSAGNYASVSLLASFS